MNSMYAIRRDQSAILDQEVWERVHTISFLGESEPDQCVKCEGGISDPGVSKKELTLA
jgi:hypothetical protein